MHLRRHAGRVGIPVQQVERERVVAHEVVVDDKRPDQVVGSQHVERGRHLAALEIAALVHLVFQRLKLFLVDKHAKFAGLLEIHHSNEEGSGLDAVVAVFGHVGQGGC